MSNQLGFPLYVNGKRFEEPVNISHVPGPVGEYFAQPMQGLGATVRFPQKGAPINRRATGEYFAQPMSGGSDPSGLGEYFKSSLLGIGADEAPVTLSPGQIALVTVAALGLRAAGGYYAGKAMGDKYRWWGLGAGMVGGVLGLGVLGFIAGRK